MADYTIDLCEGGIVTTTVMDPEPYPGSPATNVFDNNSITYWNSQQPPQYPNEWITYNFGEPKKIQKIIMGDEVGLGAYMPTSFMIQGYDSGWSDIKSYTGLAWINYETKEFEFTNSTRYQIYRFLFLSGSAVAITISEIEMMEVVTVAANPDRPDNISELYHKKQTKMRGKAAEGFIRPTIAEFFTSKDFEEIEVL